MKSSFALAITASGLASANAWGGEGHRSLAVVAREVLQQNYPESWQAIDTVLRAHGDDFVHAATWADEVKSKFHFTRNWHFADTPTHQCEFRHNPDCGKNDLCLAGVLSKLSTGQPISKKDTLRNVIPLGITEIANEIELNPIIMANMIPADNSYFMELMKDETEDDLLAHEEEFENNLLGRSKERHHPDQHEVDNRHKPWSPKNKDKKRKEAEKGKKDDTKPRPLPSKDTNCTEKDDMSCWSPAERVKWAVHFIGDEHQPLHVAWAADRGGNDINTNLGNLHFVWDSVVIREHMKETNIRTAAYIDSFSKTAPVAIKHANVATALIDEVGISNAVDEWATETAKLACSEAYIFNSKEIKNNEFLDAKKYASVKYPIIEDRLIVGGARLAAYLDAIIRSEKNPSKTVDVTIRV